MLRDHPAPKALGWMVAGAVLVAGCQYLAPPHQSWTFARVQGRVMDGATGLPIPNAFVSRVKGPELGDAYPSEKGARHLQDRPVIASTGSDGRFELVGEKTAQLFLESFPSFVVTLKVQRSGYQPFQRQFTNVVMGTNGQAPSIDTGDLVLTPAR